MKKLIFLVLLLSLVLVGCGDNQEDLESSIEEENQLEENLDEDEKEIKEDEDEKKSKEDEDEKKSKEDEESKENDEENDDLEDENSSGNSIDGFNRYHVRDLEEVYIEGLELVQYAYEIEEVCYFLYEGEIELIGEIIYTFDEMYDTNILRFEVEENPGFDIRISLEEDSEENPDPYSFNFFESIITIGNEDELSNSMDLTKFSEPTRVRVIVDQFDNVAYYGSNYESSLNVKEINVIE